MTSQKKRAADGNSTCLELQKWTGDVATILVGLARDTDKGKPLRAPRLPAIPKGVKTTDVADLLRRSFVFTCDQAEALRGLREGDRHGAFFLRDGYTALRSALPADAPAEVLEECRAFEQYFGDMAPRMANHLSPSGCLWDMLIDLERLPAYAGADRFVPRLLNILFELAVRNCPEADVMAYLILWERVLFGACDRTSGYTVQCAVAELFASRFLLVRWDSEVHPSAFPAACALYWGMIIAPLGFGDLGERSRLNCVFDAKHFFVEDRDDADVVVANLGQMCFDGALRAVSGE